MQLKNLARIGISALLLGVMPAVSQAQDKKVHINLGGGPTFIAGDLGSHFSTGWGPAVGVTVDVNPRIGIQFEYAYRRFGINDNLDNAFGVLDAFHSTHQLDFNLVATVTPPDSRVRGYLTFGGGPYDRTVTITKYEGSGIICDPFWYVCGTYPISSVLASRGGWDMGIDAGGGVGFRIGEDAEFYVESRFHYVWGPEVTGTIVGSGGSTNGSYFPLTFGFRF